MTTTSEAPGLPVLSKAQFVALMAMLMAINALSIDIMLPGLQEIGASLGVVDENHRQYVITAYLIGMGSAQLFSGLCPTGSGAKSRCLPASPSTACAPLPLSSFQALPGCSPFASSRVSVRQQRGSSLCRSSATSMAAVRWRKSCRW